MTLREEFLRVFKVPPAMHPYVDMVVEEQEMELVVKLGHNTLSPEEIAPLLGMGVPEATEYLERAYRRHVVGRVTEDGQVRYHADTFYERLNPLSMFENWGDVPAEARDAVIEWQLEEFIDKFKPVVETLEKDPDAFVRLPNRDMLLLHEALEIVQAATEHAVAPCDCRAIVMACNRPSEACIRLNEGARYTVERGLGRAISKEECIALVIEMDRAGLMHTGEREWRKRDEIWGFCSCCACDCYPIRAGERMGIPRQWPRAHYVAERDLSMCIHCGTCAERCHFQAFYVEESGAGDGKGRRKVVQFDAEKCWGCGLCANACSQGAIHMAPLAEASMEERE